MIKKTFMFLPGVGYVTEKNIWQQGVSIWNDFLNKERISGIGKSKKIYFDMQLKQAASSLSENDSAYFSNLLPKREHWRLYDYFRDEVVFLDIETADFYGYPTVVGLYDGYEVKQMVRGANLNGKHLRDELKNYKMVVTFNGSGFDIPVLNSFFYKVIPDILHFDLRHLCSRIGLRGGLKMIENDLGIKRSKRVQQLSGFGAVEMWDRFRERQDESYLQLLLEYNAEDVINLKPIADYAVKEMEKKLQSAL